MHLIRTRVSVIRARPQNPHGPWQCLHYCRGGICIANLYLNLDIQGILDSRPQFVLVLISANFGALWSLKHASDNAELQYILLLLILSV